METRPLVLDVADRIRFQQSVMIDDGCWLWPLQLNNSGYGYFATGGDKVLAHRVSYEMFNGPIPVGMVLDHTCSIRHCVNPSHLEAVTQRENLLRGNTIAAHNANRTHCNEGHEFTPENTYMKAGFRACKECRKVQNASNYSRRQAALTA